jgi:hypothetical protein
MVAFCKEGQARLAHSIRFRAFSVLSTTNTCNFSLNFLAKYLLYNSAASASVKIGSVLLPLESSIANSFFALYAITKNGTLSNLGAIIMKYVAAKFYHRNGCATTHYLCIWQHSLI